MLKYIISGLFVCAILPLQAQTKQDSLNQKLIKEISDMQQKYVALSDLNKKVEEINKTVESGNSRAITTENKLKSIENLAENTNERFNKLAVDEVKTKENQHKSNYDSFVTTADFIEQVNSAITTFDASNAQMSYLNSIADLNNPQSNALGFKLDEVVTGLIRDKLMPRARDKSAFSKAMEFTKTMITSPLVQGATTGSAVGNVIRSITNTVPGVNTLTSVFGLIANLAISDKGLKAEDLKAFSDELKKYIVHYESLAKANQEFEYSVSSLKIKTASLRNLATNFARENATDLYHNDPSVNKNDINKMELTDLLDKHFNSRHVENYFKKQEERFKNDYKKLTEKFTFSFVGRARVSLIRDELEKIYSEQLSTYETYQKNLIVILKNASEISSNKSQVTSTLTNLEGNFKQMIESYQKQVKLDRVLHTANQVPRY